MIEEIKTGLESVATAIQILKAGAKLLPNDQQQQTEQQISSAERQLRLAESQIAQGLDYDLCRCTFPPQIMLYNRQENANICPSCGNTNSLGISVSLI